MLDVDRVQAVRLGTKERFVVLPPEENVAGWYLRPAQGYPALVKHKG